MIGRHLRDVPQENNFVLKTGQQIKNLNELCLHLAGMDDETFSHHVNEDKNDFQNWVFDTVKDEKLAKRIAKAPNRKKMANIVHNRVTELEQEKRRHENVLEHGIKWGVKEFGIGLVRGLFLGLIFFKMTGLI